MSFELGMCALCAQEMIRDTEDGDVWHPYTVERACPPEPADYDSEAWQQFYAKGLRSGRPGAQYFIKQEATL